MDLFVDNDLYDNESCAAANDWKIGKKPETYLKKIEFDININGNGINNLNNKDVNHLNDSLSDDNNTDIEDSGVQHKQDDQHNGFCALVENKLQPIHQLRIQQIHFDTTQDDNQEYCGIIENSDHESDGLLEDSQ